MSLPTNDRGTEHLVNACLETGVQKLVYTSTASVVFDGSDIKQGDESSLEYPRRFLDPYSATKALGEQVVLRANGKKSPSGDSVLYTCSLRPHIIFGPRDSHFLPKLVSRAREGEITHTVGDGKNIVDFTYVQNVVHAHVLAAEKLGEGSAVNGQCFFITNGQPRQFWDVISVLLRQTGSIGPKGSISYKYVLFC